MMQVNSKTLRDAAFELNLSTYQIASAARVPQPSVREILTGERAPTSDQLRKICDVLDIETGEVKATKAEAKEARI